MSLRDACGELQKQATAAQQEGHVVRVIGALLRCGIDGERQVLTVGSNQYPLRPMLFTERVRGNNVTLVGAFRRLTEDYGLSTALLTRVRPIRVPGGAPLGLLETGTESNVRFAAVTAQIYLTDLALGKGPLISADWRDPIALEALYRNDMDPVVQDVYGTVMQHFNRQSNSG